MPPRGWRKSAQEAPPALQSRKQAIVDATVEEFGNAAAISEVPDELVGPDRFRVEAAQEVEEPSPAPGARKSVPLTQDMRQAIAASTAVFISAKYRKPTGITQHSSVHDVSFLKGQQAVSDDMLSDEIKGRLMVCNEITLDCRVKDGEGVLRNFKRYEANWLKGLA